MQTAPGSGARGNHPTVDDLPAGRQLSGRRSTEVRDRLCLRLRGERPLSTLVGEIGTGLVSSEVPVVCTVPRVLGLCRDDGGNVGIRDPGSPGVLVSVGRNAGTFGAGHRAQPIEPVLRSCP